MFLLILVMTSIWGLGQATDFLTHPVDTLALLGGNVSFTCKPKSESCGEYLYWQRGPEMTPTFDKTIFNGTKTHRRFTGSERYSVSFRNCTSTLSIQNIQTVDERYYSCSINDGFSDVSNLSIVDPINTTVLPLQIDINAGENAYFSCHTRQLDQYRVEYTWYVKTQGSYEWKELFESNARIDFGNIKNSNNLTMLRLGIEMNNSMVQCSVNNGASSLTGLRQTGWLFVHPAEEAIAITSVLVTSAPSSQDSIVILAGWPVAGVLLILLIVILLYFLVFRGRSQSKTIDRRQSHTPQDDGGESDADGISETQLHGDTPRCDQENEHTSSAGERSVESQKETVTVCSGNIGQAEAMYAVVDKSRAKSKTLGAISTEKASWKGFKGGKDGSMLNRGTDTSKTSSGYSSPSERQKPTVAVKALAVPGSVAFGQTPPRVVPYHLSKRQASTETQAQAGPEQDEDGVGEDTVEDDSLHYANLELSRGSARSINPEEQTTYADIEK